MSNSSGIFCKIRNNLSIKAKLDYYYVFMYPYITYNIVVWGGKYPSSNFFQYKILKIPDVYRYFVSIFMFKARRDGLFLTDHGYETRFRDSIAPSHFHRLNSSQRS